MEFYVKWEEGKQGAFVGFSSELPFGTLEFIVSGVTDVEEVFHLSSGAAIHFKANKL